MKDYWFRQIVGGVVGVAWGVAGLEGWVAILAFAAVLEITLIGYKSMTADEDDEDFEDDDDAQKPSRFDGFMPAFGMFLCFWIFTYNLTLDY